MDVVPFIVAVQSAVPGLKIQSTRPYKEGWDFFVLEVNQEWIFRFPRRPDGVAQLEKEVDFLQQTAPLLPVAVPRYEILHLKSPLPFGAYRKLAGNPLSAATGRFSSFTLQELGRFLTSLHRMDTTSGFPGGYDWAEKHRKLENRVRGALFPSMEVPQQEGLEELFHHLHQELWQSNLPLCLIHGDLSASHLLLEEDHLTGVIDWGDVCIGDPAHDFAALWLEFGEGTARKIAGYYSGIIDSSFWDRADLYRRLAPVYGWLHSKEREERKKA